MPATVTRTPRPLIWESHKTRCTASGFASRMIRSVSIAYPPRQHYVNTETE